MNSCQCKMKITKTNLLTESKNIRELKPNDLKADQKVGDLARNLLHNLQAPAKDDLDLALGLSLEALVRKLTSEMSPQISTEEETLVSSISNSIEF